ncbi:hypothetical protein BT96DRAFT_1018342 [Gymnopus androsaceus JB14]|uniref:Mid2 domain-containing protein n=1 Tax=Gymnopus androsaceus JB14 TaxID=1447944 RepID=A0A6A4HTQ2_9AGAR|nr:hypothetical protein BT96DRAFT_1018342 [Gymnopus androsaceus JB14]
MSLRTIPTPLYLCHSFLSFLYILSWSSSTIGLVGAATTIFDDASSAFTFALGWHAVTLSDPCDACALKLNPTEPLDSTWHQYSVAGSTASFIFEGTGVALYGVDLDLSAIPDTPTNTYNYSFFTASSLSSGSHTLSWTIETSVDNAVAVIDYAVVTSDDPTPATSSISSASTTPSSSTGGFSMTSVMQAVGSSFTTSPSPMTSTSSTAASSTSGAASSTTNTSTTSVSPSAVVITIGESVITSMVLSPTTTSASTAALAAPKPKTFTIIGAVVGSIIGFMSIGVIICLLLRRRYRSMAPSAAAKLETFRYDHNLNNEAARGIYPREKTRRSAPLSETSSGSNASVASPSSTASAPIEQMEQRILLLERMFQQPDEAAVSLHNTSPPPYLAG